ncbi:ParB N-terminal domain-containing protein [Halomonas sp. FeN2]|uniref:ParB/Srx family N-terminal domain-containing protein n=1 Tax=Halomonas sp. FeN2 TaxID=2832500 RepID=UPI001D0A8385|nr:ParB/Srx family N-terminal domain-containing protein [Halomonas sp. FeN2]UBR49169.1 ParB N-terminal domain-containing protein [Halomonas sp. FeN2]
MSRRNFTIEEVSVDDLLLDVGNARIRTGADQRDCIEKILAKEDQMLTLIQDIAENGLTTMPILIQPLDDGKWLVWDGNRRTTALKLLRHPERCPVEYLKPKIKKIAEEFTDSILDKVECLSSNDIQSLEKEVIARHSGAMGGAGQLPWAAYMKAVFSLNHNGATDYRRAGKYLLWAESKGLVVEDDFPITNLHRFFTKENIVLLGFEVQSDDSLKLMIPEVTAKSMAVKIISDFGGGKPVREVFSPESAKSYLYEVRESVGLNANCENQDVSNFDTGARAEGESGLNSQESSSSNETAGINHESASNNSQSNGSNDVEPEKPAGTGSQVKGTVSASWERPGLFPRGKDGIPIPSVHKKAKNIVAELRRLKTNGNKSTPGTPIAVAMLLRALIEISTENYCNNFSDVKKDQDFTKQVAKVADHMLDSGFIAKDQHEVVMRQTRSSESMLHIKTIQKYVHSASFHPTGQILNSLWDEISVYIGVCWRAKPS